ncbi:MAG TPA: cyclase family protein [Candidatus Andersenbacteria bacterium]|nr:cyclase family protein [Candidatus Andersenbacteria bacterium]
MFIDISRPIHPDMAIYPNNPGVSMEPVQTASADQSGLTTITLGSHTGTHIDALSHIKANGSGIEQFDLNQFIGPVDVVEIPNDTSVITAQDIPETTSPKIIFKTKNSERPINEFDPDFVAIDETAAQELVRRNIVLVGIDALSIKKKGVHDRVHAILLEANIVILEGLYMADVDAGKYNLICLPLSIAGIDGVPARAVLSSYGN